MSDESIVTTLDDGVLTLACNRPAVSNAITAALLNRVRDAIWLAARDPTYASSSSQARGERSVRVAT